MSTGLAPGSWVGEYRIEHVLGRGGWATVYAAIHPVLLRRAAVKVIHKELCGDAAAVDRFVNEARAVNRVRQANVVDVFSFGQLPDGQSYFVMEFLEGRTLKERLDVERIPPVEAARIFCQLCDALAAAHAVGVVHRNLKPENVMLVGAGEPLVKLLDFGIAKLVSGGAPERQTSPGLCLGTLEYVSPEQAIGRPLDASSDVYSLGVMLFETMLGRAPFIAEDAIGVARMHVAVTAPRARALWPEVPEALEQLIAGMLEKSPAKRPSLQTVRATLAALAAQTPVVAELAVPDSASFSAPVSPVAPPRARRVWWAGAAAAAALSLMGVMALGRSPAPPSLERAVAAWAVAPRVQVAAKAGASTSAREAVAGRPAAAPSFVAASSSPVAVPSSPAAVPSSPAAVPSSPAAVPSSPAAVPSSPVAVPSPAAASSSKIANTPSHRAHPRRHARNPDYLVNPFGPNR